MTAAKFCFWFAVAMAVLGELVTRMPGSGLWYFCVATLFALPGLLIPSRRYRIAAALLACFLAGNAGMSYFQGVRYQEWLREKGYENSSNQPLDRTQPRREAS